MSRKYRKSNFSQFTKLVVLLIATSSYLIYSRYPQYISFISALCLILSLAYFGSKFLSRHNKKTAYLSSGIRTVDTMSGTDFEKFLDAHFSKLAYKVTLTPQSNDYGADLILVKDGIKTVVQAKRYSTKKTVGIKAVQEVIGAVHHYNANNGMIVTNNYFSSQAKALASSANVTLIDRSELVDIMNKNGANTILDSIHKDQSTTCPLCNATLVSRKGKFGVFIGCSSFPKCSYTRHVNS